MVPTRSDHPSTHPSLLEGVRARCSRAWGLFSRRYARIIRRWCERHRLPPDACDDLFQDLLLALPRKLLAYQREDDDGGVNPFRSWLRAVVRHAAADVFRRRDRRPADYAAGGIDLNTIPTLAGDLEGQLADTHRADVAAIVRAVRAKVAAETWAVYEQVNLLDRPPADVAARFGKTVTAVYMTVHRVNRMLRAEYHRRMTTPADEGPDHHDPLPDAA